MAMRRYLLVLDMDLLALDAELELETRWDWPHRAGSRTGGAHGSSGVIQRELPAGPR
jgi:hypothetical protein